VNNSPNYSSLDVFYIINFMFFFYTLFRVACSSVICVLKYLLTYLLKVVVESDMVGSQTCNL